jgi:hypothetical protein
MPMIDSALQLITSGPISSSTDFAPLACAPRFLPTCAWVINILSPPAASCTFTLAVSTTQNGTYRTIETYTWPAGVTGAKQLRLGAGGNLAQVLDNQSVWLRASVALTGPLTMAGSWLTKAADGGPGLASRSYTLDNINVI